MIFVDREEELKRLQKRTLQFPLPKELKSAKSRNILFLIGAKGVGKTSILKQLINLGVKDTRFVYVEFRGPYGSVEDLLVNLLVQYDENFGRGFWEVALRKGLEVFGIKLLGKEAVDAIKDPSTIEFMRQAKPSMIITQLEEEACKICEKSNLRLVIIYDEFQNFLKTLSISGDRFRIVLDSFVTYFSKSQEWGFSSTKGYPIRILSTSDYSFYEMMDRYRTSYLEEEYIEELSEESSRELFKACLNEFELKSDVIAETYICGVLGGNPSLFVPLLSKIKEKTDVVTVEDGNETLDEKIKEIKGILAAQNFDNQAVLRGLYRICRGGETKWVALHKLLEYASVSSFDFDTSIKDLLLKNILQIRSGNAAFQNRLIQHATEELF